MLTLQLALTLLVLVAALLIIVRIVIVEKRPRKDLNPGLIPTTPVMIASGFVALLAFIHLINLVGFHTGRYH